MSADGGPAFPVPDLHPGALQVGSSGMSLRDWFAGQVLVGLLGKLPLIDQSGEFGAKVEDKVAYNLDVADSCYQIADAMLRARERGQEGGGR